jgi:hypothetical protein
MTTKVILHPVACAWCKQDIPGQVSECQHSHGICDKCIIKHFPDLVLDPKGGTPDTVGTTPPTGTGN